MNQILKLEWTCIEGYVDNIIIFSHIWEDYPMQLYQIITLPIQNNIFLETRKFFIDYLPIHLVGQKIDLSGLGTIEKKRDIIFKLKFSCILKQLEYYLDLTGWLYNYIKRCTKITKSLEFCKSRLISLLLIDFLKRG